MSKTIGAILALVLIGVASFAAYNFAWELGMRDPAENLWVERCPISEAESLIDYHFAVSGLINEHLETAQSTAGPEERAQRYRAMAVELDSLSYPDCAQLLHEMLYKTFEYEARAQAALAEGGVISGMIYQYYHMLSVDNLYLVPFIINMIDPPLPLNDGRLRA